LRTISSLTSKTAVIADISDKLQSASYSKIIILRQELYIDCIKNDWNTGVITHLGIGRAAYDVMHIVRVH
jgi:hypothetical protein